MSHAQILIERERERERITNAFHTDTERERTNEQTRKTNWSSGKQSEQFALSEYIYYIRLLSNKIYVAARKSHSEKWSKAMKLAKFGFHFETYCA